MTFDEAYDVISDVFLCVGRNGGDVRSDTIEETTKRTVYDILKAVNVLKQYGLIRDMSVGGLEGYTLNMEVFEPVLRKLVEEGKIVPYDRDGKKHYACIGEEGN